MVANLGFEPESPITECSPGGIASVRSTIALGLGFPVENVSVACFALRRRGLLDSVQGRALLQDEADECNAVIVMRTTLDIGNATQVASFQDSLVDMVNNDMEGVCPLVGTTISTKLTAASVTGESCDDFSARVQGSVSATSTIDGCEPEILPIEDDDDGGMELWLIILIVLLAILLPLLCCCIVFILWRRKKRAQEEEERLADKVGGRGCL